MKRHQQLLNLNYLMTGQLWYTLHICHDFVIMVFRRETSGVYTGCIDSDSKVVGKY